MCGKQFPAASGLLAGCGSGLDGPGPILGGGGDGGGTDPERAIRHNANYAAECAAAQEVI